MAFEAKGLPLSILFGFVAGAIVLNVVKEELPGVDRSRFAAFAVGAAAYAVVLLLTRVAARIKRRGRASCHPGRLVGQV